MDVQRLAITDAPDVRQLSTSVLLLVHAFTGFESIGIPAGEVKEPQRTVPFALFTVLGIVGNSFTSLSKRYVLARFSRPGYLGETTRRCRRPSVWSRGWRSYFRSGGCVDYREPQRPKFLGDAANTLRDGRAATAATGVRTCQSAFSDAAYGDSAFLCGYHRLCLVRHLRSVARGSASFRDCSSTRRHARRCRSWCRRGDAPPALFTAPWGITLTTASLDICAWLMANSSFGEAVAIAALTAVGLVLHVLHGATSGWRR